MKEDKMKLRTLMVVMATTASFLIAASLHAANGDLIVDGNLGVGTPTPAEKAEISGNAVVSGNMKAGTATVTDNAEVGGNLAVSGDLMVSGTVSGNKIGHVEVFSSSGVWNTPANIQGAVILAAGGGGGGGRSSNGIGGPFWEAINGAGGGGAGDARYVQVTPALDRLYGHGWSRWCWRHSRQYFRGKRGRHLSRFVRDC